MAQDLQAPSITKVNKWTSENAVRLLIPPSRILELPGNLNSENKAQEKQI